jgi:hypothetical protein
MGLVGRVFNTVWTACSSPMSKLAYERKICLIYKIISLSFILGI